MSVEGPRPAPDYVEAESAESNRVWRWSSTLCSPLRGGGGFKPAERGPGGSLTATYCTPFEEPGKMRPLPQKMAILRLKMALGGLFGASWEPLGGLLGAPGDLLGALGGLLGASWGLLGHLGRI